MSVSLAKRYCCKVSLNKNDVRFRAITGENENGEKVISFYSNRNHNTGLEHNAQNYTLSTSADDGVIITYKSQKSFKEVSLAKRYCCKVSLIMTDLRAEKPEFH